MSPSLSETGKCQLLLLSCQFECTQLRCYFLTSRKFIFGHLFAKAMNTCQQALGQPGSHIGWCT